MTHSTDTKESLHTRWYVVRLIGVCIGVPAKYVYLDPFNADLEWGEDDLAAGINFALIDPFCRKEAARCSGGCVLLYEPRGLLVWSGCGRWALW